LILSASVIWDSSRLTRLLIGRDWLSHGHDEVEPAHDVPAAEAGPPARLSEAGSTTATNPATTANLGR